MNHQPALIGIDWGTTSFRAWLLDRAGGVLDHRAAARGVQAAHDSFQQTLLAEVGAWLRGLPVLMCGMIGSRQGWVEASYVECPTTPLALAGALAPVAMNGCTIRIVPGLKAALGDGCDVCRGEETQVFGAMQRFDIDDGTFVLPGTHAKWVTVKRRRIASFRTFMTGELYAACRSHTILGRLMADGAASEPAFRRGVREGAEPGPPGVLLHRLFRVRTEGLLGKWRDADLPDYLSGMLIGAEVAANAGAARGRVHVLASDALASRYAIALSELGLDGVALPEDCVLDGLTAIAQAAGLI